jgi:hypothetical protein
MEQRISHTRKTAATFLYRSELLVVLIVLHPEDKWTMKKMSPKSVMLHTGQ